MRKLIESFIFPEVPEDIGEVHVEWRAPEYETHERSKVWYIIAGILALAAFGFSIWTVNFFLPVIVVLAGVILILQHKREPKQVNIKISDLGMLIGRDFYPHAELESFWFAYQPPEVKNLYLEFRKATKKRRGIPLQDTNPLAVREILEQYVDEDLEKESESLEDFLARRFKL